MAENPKSTPSFFKVLINDEFSRKLRLPPAFVLKWAKILPQISELRTGSGQKWDVRVEKMEDEYYYFNRGWAKISQALGLEIGEFLVFWLRGNTAFDVSVYGISGCLRETSATSSPVKDSDPDEAVESEDYTYADLHSDDYHARTTKRVNLGVESEDDDLIDPKDESGDGKILRFNRKLKKSDSSRLTVSKAFALATGLAKRRMIHLQDSKSRQWPVRVVCREERCTYGLTSGWKDFLVGNKVAIGNTICLECEVGSGSLIKACVLINGTKKRQLFGTGRLIKEGRLSLDSNDVSCKEEESVFF